MKHKTAYYGRIFFILLFVVGFTALGVTGCGKQKKKEKAEDEIYLYYTDKDHTRLLPAIYKPKSEDTLEEAKEVIDKMNETSTELNNVTAKPDTVKINDIQYENKILAIDFNEGYKDMGSVTELLCRSAIVLTVTQIDGIECVVFTIDGEPLVNSQNVPVGRMTASDFVDNGESNINSFRMVEAELYFADSNGKGLSTVSYKGMCNQNMSVEKFIIEKLIEGPEDSLHLRTLPAGLRLISVLTKDGICYVNFDAAFLTEITDCSAELELYSIVNSLCELSYINKVQISVNGNTDKKLRDEISLEYAFSRNLDIVVEESFSGR